MSNATVRQFPGAEEDNTGIRKHLWTRDEVYRAMAAGVFDGQPTDWLKMELIEGELIEKMPQNRPHSIALAKGQRILARAFGEACYIGIQAPLQVDRESEPEPDLMVVPGDPDTYPDHPHGSEVLLVVEISDTSLRHDRDIKSRLYARVGVPEYWILVLKSRSLEIHRDPLPQTEAGHSTYRTVQVLREQETVTPLRAPGAVIAVSNLLPAVE